MILRKNTFENYPFLDGEDFKNEGHRFVHFRGGGGLVSITQQIVDMDSSHKSPCDWWACGRKNRVLYCVKELSRG